MYGLCCIHFLKYALYFFSSVNKFITIPKELYDNLIRKEIELEWHKEILKKKTDSLKEKAAEIKKLQDSVRYYKSTTEGKKEKEKPIEKVNRNL